MKSKIFALIVPVALMMLSCAKDNYDMPDLSLTGRVVYNGEPINVEYDQVRLQLWESGWQLRNPIDIVIKQDGSYSAVLFKGSYKMVIPAGQGPFMTTTNDVTESDTIALELNGSKMIDIEVTPYYMVRSPQLTKNGNVVSASFSLEKIVTDANAKDIDRVFLYLNKTQFVSGTNNIRVSELAGGDIADLSNITLSVDVPEMIPAQSYVYARIGVRIAGVQDLIFSPVQKIGF